MNKILKGLFPIAALTLLFCSPIRADDDEIPKPQLDRPTVAILFLRNASGNTNLMHWQRTFASGLKKQIGEVKSIRIIPESSTDYAFQQLKLEPGQVLEHGQVRKLGQLMQTQRVVWGEFQQKDGNWKVTVQVMKASDGKTSDPLTTSFPEISKVCLETSRKILSAMDVHPTDEEKKRMGFWFNASDEAIESVSRAREGNERGESVVKSEEGLRHALTLNPDFFEAQYAAAFCLLIQGKLDEAKASLKELIKLRPDYAPVHETLGSVYLYQDLIYSAREEFLKAVRLDPDDPKSYLSLSSTYSKQLKYEQALAILKLIEGLAPHDTDLYAGMALDYIGLKQPDQALSALSKAEAYHVEKDFEAEQRLAGAYYCLNEDAKAAEHYEKLLAPARQRGAKSPVLDQAEEILAKIRTRLTPHFIEAAAPQSFTQEELEKTLKTKLSPEEYKLVVNPLTSTPDMKKWAESLVGDASTEEEKARRLYYGLTRHIDLDHQHKYRTAEQTFKEWSNPNVNFVCQEYTLLYVALARQVGLKAFYVLVEKDHRGRLVPHACAGVFVGEKALLADPTYHWFGVPHEKVEFKNDIEVVALYLSQLGGINKGEVAIKLMPDSNFIRFNQALELAHANRTTMARQELKRGLAIDSTSWLALYTQGMIVGSEKGPAEAVEYLKQCVSLNPEFPPAHYRLATALGARGELSEALDEFRTYLKAAPNGEFAEKTLDYISNTEELLKSQSNKTQK